MENIKVMDIKEIKGKILRNGFMAYEEIYFDLKDEGVYKLRRHNLELVKAVSLAPFNSKISTITDVFLEIDKKEFFDELKVLIDCEENGYSFALTYSIPNPREIPRLTLEGPVPQLGNYFIDITDSKINPFVKKLNEKLIGRIILKVLGNKDLKEICFITDTNVIEIKINYSHPNQNFNFNLDNLEGKIIERVIYKVSLDLITIGLIVNDLSCTKSQLIEIPNTITLKEPNSYKELLMISESSYYRVYYSESFKFSDIIGETIVDIIGGQGDGELTLRMANGYDIVLYHEQDCCEYVYLYDVAGNLEDLIGSPLVQAEESTSDGGEDEDCCESRTWTFYKFATAKGYVTLRWLGESNGYYSEAVDIRIEPSMDNYGNNKNVYLQ